MLYMVLIGLLIAATSAQDISDVIPSEISDDVIAIIEILDPENLPCNATDQDICDQVDWLVCFHYLPFHNAI